MLINYIKKEDLTIKITPNHPIDIHILNQIIDESHCITMSTTRKVQIGNQKTRISVKLTIQVTEVSAYFENNALNIRGSVKNEVENVKLGSFHNLTIGLNEPFVLHVENKLQNTVEKLLKKLDVFLLVVFRNGKFEVAAIDEYGLRNKGSFKQNTFKKFLLDSCTTEKPTTKQQFPLKSTYKVEYIVTNHQISNFMSTKIPTHKFTLTAADEKASLSQIFEKLLENPDSSSIPFMKDLVQANNFVLMYEKGNNKIALGMTDVIEAQEYSAIQTLFVTNKLYCAFDHEERNKVRSLIKSLNKTEKAIVISDSHACGIKLNNIGGIGAILSFDYRSNLQDN